MAKAEISWKGKTEDGNRREVYARKIGDRWVFFERERRYDCWQPLNRPPLSDWLELLDGIERRVARRLLRPEEIRRVKKSIAEFFPGTDI